MENEKSEELMAEVIKILFRIKRYTNKLKNKQCKTLKDEDDVGKRWVETPYKMNKMNQTKKWKKQ
ncbi:hypothetical protein HHI36_004530, partial [Cryptolaemus montrouzieri]